MEATFTEAKCPKCHKIHSIKKKKNGKGILWTGDVMPRIFCDDCHHTKYHQPPEGLQWDM